MTRSKVDERLARQSARDLLAEEGITAVPVDPEALAARTGFPVHETDQGFQAGVFGAIVKLGSADVQLMLSLACPTLGHRRFTIAHELGHLHIPGHVEVLLAPQPAHFSRGSNFRSKKDWWEVEADLFASELLMPERLVCGVVRQQPRGLDAILKLAELCQTSLSSAAIRYTQLTDDHVLVVLSKDGIVEWSSASMPLARHSWARKLRKQDWAPPQSATRILARDVSLVRAGETRHSDGEFFSSWIEDAPAVPLQEEAMGMGNYGRVLTVLACDPLPDPEVLEEREHRRAQGPTTWTARLRSFSLDDPHAPE